jgi:hypothetical protein
MLKHFRRFRFIMAMGTLALLTALFKLIPMVQPFLEGDYFRGCVASQIGQALGLNVQIGKIRWVGFFGFEVDSIIGSQGNPMDGFYLPRLKGYVHPLSPFFQLWELDEVQADQATIIVKLPDHSVVPPDASKQPWWFPKRVRVQHLLVNHGDIISSTLGPSYGIFNSRMVINHFGRDYDYDAQDGTLRMPFFPKMHLVHLDFSVENSNLEIHELLFDTDPNSPDNNLRLSGSLGLNGDESTSLHVNWNMLDITKWFAKPPMNIRGLANGQIDGDINHYDWNELALNGSMKLANGSINGITVLNQSGVLTLDRAQADVSIKNGVLSLTHLIINSEENIQATGSLSIDFIHNFALNGNVILEVNKESLSESSKTIFNSTNVCTPIVIGGTLQNPTEDLTGRLQKSLKPRESK